MTVGDIMRDAQTSQVVTAAIAEEGRAEEGERKEESVNLARPEARPQRLSLARQLLAGLGPGLMACLADTDGPCLLTAAQSGAQWGYSLLGLQLVLIPILFFAQELAARLGVIRGMGTTAMLRHDIGPKTAWAVSTPLLLACLLGLVSEYSIIGQTMAFWGVPLWVTNSAITMTLLGVVVTGSYRTAEMVGLALGVCQIALFPAMFSTRPSAREIGEGLQKFPLQDGDFMKLVTANIGAVIMPWMLAYQQSAICNKGLDEHPRQHLLLARVDTGLGAVLTQGVMAAMLVTVAASVKPGTDVASVADLHEIFARALGGEDRARWLLTFAIVGACMVAAIVQTLCAAWTLEQALGRATATMHNSPALARGGGWRAIHRNVCERPAFYASYAAACIGAFLFTMAFRDAVDVSIATQICNGILMPPIIFALWYLSAFKLPEEYRMGCVYKWVVFAVFLVCALFCLASVFIALAR